MPRVLGHVHGLRRHADAHVPLAEKLRARHRADGTELLRLALAAPPEGEEGQYDREPEG